MQSWWELGEWTGYSGGDLAIHNITCAFCLEGGNFRKLNHWQKESSSKHKILNYDILQSENCGNLTMVFWSSGSRLHDWRTVPWPLRLEKALSPGQRMLDVIGFKPGVRRKAITGTRQRSWRAARCNWLYGTPGRKEKTYITRETIWLRRGNCRLE